MGAVWDWLNADQFSALNLLAFLGGMATMRALTSYLERKDRTP
jgi:hypothetical protein